MQAQAWISALRLRTLPLAVSGIAAGSALAAHLGHRNTLITVLCLATAAALQILSNLANDYGDFTRGTDNNQRVGPERALQSGRIRPAAMLRAIWISGVVSAVLALSVIALAFPAQQWLEAFLFIALAAAALWAAVNYTMGKNPYGYSGLGDVFVGLFFGLLAVLGTAWLHSLEFQVLALAPALGMAGFSMGVLHMNNMRDQVGDAASGKITLAVRLGMAGGKTYHFFWVFLGLIGWWSPGWIEGLSVAQASMWLGPGTVLSLFQLQGVMRTQNYTSFDTWLKVMVLACLCKLQSRLIHLGIPSNQGSNPGSAHAVALRHRINQNQMLLHAFQGQGAGKRLPVVHKLAVHFVGKQKQIVFQHQTAQGFQGRFRIHGSGRIPRIAYHNGLGFRSNFFGKGRRRRQGKPIINVGRNRHNLRPGSNSKGGIIRIKRLWNNHFVARIQAAH